jgi:hypothetical protein
VSALLLGLGLAVLASLALNGGFLLQSAGSRTAPEITARHPVTTIVGLLRSPLWLAGLCMGLTGWAFHVGALSQAPLSLVQAFTGAGLALAVPVGARILREPMSRGEASAVVLMAVALALLALGLQSTPVRSVPASAMTLYLLGACGLAALLAAPSGGQLRGRLLGVAGGVLYGVADTAMKAVTTAAHAGVSHALTSPWLAAVTLATAGAFFAFQRGLQTGRPVTIIALMTAATNTGSIAGGFVVFGDRLGATPALAVAHVIGFVLVVVAAWRLAPAQAALAAGADPAPHPFENQDEANSSMWGISARQSAQSWRPG